MGERREILKSFEENKDYITKRLSEGIEKHRKGKAVIEITDENGRPVPNAQVEIKQVSHAFKYGANIYMLDEFESAEKNKLYRERFKEICNIATLPFYWRDLEPTEGKPRFAKDSERVYRRPPLDLCMEYCKENGIEPKEHCLVYETWMPTWLDKNNLGLMKEKYEERIRILAERYRKDIPVWEVTNETLQIFQETSVLYRQPDLVEWSFKCAEKYLSENRLMINDAHYNIWNVFNGNRSQYYMQIERAIQNGARIDGIGMQFHMFYRREDEQKETRRFYDPLHLYKVMDYYSNFGKPLSITELTIPAYSQNEEDEAVQAEIMKWLYTIWFSHPSMEAIIYWNLVDGYAAFAPQGDMTAGENYYHGGLMRFDMTPKPAFRTIRNLFEKEWHTEEMKCTDENGIVDFSGFYGEYEIILHGADKMETHTIHINKNSENQYKIVL